MDPADLSDINSYLWLPSSDSGDLDTGYTVGSDMLCSPQSPDSSQDDPIWGANEGNPGETAYDLLSPGIGSLYTTSLSPPRSEPLTRASLECFCTEMCITTEGFEFFPNDVLESLITEESIRATLSQPDLAIEEDKYPNDMLDYRKIFAILLLLGKSEHIVRFWQPGITDHDLPLTAASLAPIMLADIDVIYKFEEMQWKFTAPIFTHHGGIPSHFDLGDKAILPWISLPGQDGESIRSGGFSQVYRVRIHPAHFDFEEMPKSSVIPSFAVKRFAASETRQDFEREVSALKHLGRQNHPHIITLLSSFKHKGRFNLIFSWADGDLSTFWSQHPTPEASPATTRWLVDQSYGIASALAIIHDSGQGKTSIYGRHGDIKPQNILWFNDTTGGSHRDVLKIADFGLTRFHSRPVRQKVTPDTSLTRTYRPPEFDTAENGIGQSYDMWSLGCLFLEMVSWCLSGWNGVRQFAEHRASKSTDNDTCFAFFETSEGDGLPRTASVKPAIGQWNSMLRAHPLASPLSNEFLDLISRSMLVVEHLSSQPVVKRANAKQISSRLAAMQARCDSDPGYLAPHKGSCVDIDLIKWNISQNWRISLPSLSTDNDLNNWLTTNFQQFDNSTIESQQGTYSKRKHDSILDTQRQHDVEFPRNSKRKMTAKDATEPDSPRMFACPFYQNNPKKYRSKRTCCGPGWKEFHRVKEHIQRCHAPAKNSCSRCCEAFKTPTGLWEHQRSQEQCPVKESQVTDGMISLEQMESLRTQKGKQSNATDEEKWRNMYLAIFKDEDPDKVPSPFYGTGETTTSSTVTISTNSSSDLSDYKEYLLRIPSETQTKDLEKRLGSKLGISNPTMCKLIAQTFRDFQLNDLESFDQGRPGVMDLQSTRDMAPVYVEQADGKRDEFLGQTNMDGDLFMVNTGQLQECGWQE